MGIYASRPLHTKTTSTGSSSENGDGSPCPGLPIQEPTRSFWMHPPSPIGTCIPQDTVPAHADVAIIGSGISGASCAKALLELDGLDKERDGDEAPLVVVMLDAHEACSGATGRNGGHINPPLYHDYEHVKSTSGTHAAQQIMRFRLAHLEILRAVGAADAPDGDCREVEAVDVFYDEKTFREAQRLLGVYQADMPRKADTHVCTEGKAVRKRYLLSEQAVGCIATCAGAVQPYRFVTGILSRLLSDYPDQFQLYTGTPCTSITGPTDTGPFYTLHTPRGTLRARHVVHLTNAHVGGLVPGLAGVVAPVRETMSAQRPGTVLRRLLGTSSGGTGARSYVFYDSPARKGFDYLTQLPSGELMFGGGVEGAFKLGCVGNGMYDLHSAAHVSGALSVYFGANWGAEGGAGSATESEKREQDGATEWAAGRVKALWSGELSESADGFPWVGRIPARISGRPALAGDAERGAKRAPGMGEWVAAGYSGEGMVHAWLCARAVALMVLGMEERRDLDLGPGTEFGMGKTVEEWLPACFAISEARVRRASEGRRVYTRKPRTTGKARVYPGR